MSGPGPRGTVRALLAVAAATFALAAPAPARADVEREPDAEDEQEPLVTVEVDGVLGFRSVRPDMGLAEEEEEEFDPREDAVQSFILDVEVHALPWLRLDVRAPVSFAAFHFRERDGARTTSFGNVELSAQVRRTFARRTAAFFDFGLTIPTATGDEFSRADGSRRTAYANLAAARFRGFRENALFASHRAGLTPMLGVEWRAGPFEASASSKVEVLLSTGGGAPPPELGKLNDTAVEIVSGGRGLARVASWAHVGVDAWLAYTALGEVKAAEHPGLPHASALQTVVEPRFVMRARSLESSVGVLLPVGGPLADWGFHAVRFDLDVDLF